jgi:hypothetical protein
VDPGLGQDCLTFCEIEWLLWPFSAILRFRADQSAVRRWRLTTTLVASGPKRTVGQTTVHGSFKPKADAQPQRKSGKPIKIKIMKRAV